MKVCVKHVEDHAFIAKSESNHWIPFDTGPASGGSAGASDPFQTFIMSCAGCVSIDVVDILKKSRKPHRNYGLQLEATRADSIPKIVRHLYFHAHVDGDDISHELVERALRLSLTRYCSVSLSLDRSVTFSIRATVNGHRGEWIAIPRDPALYSR